MLAVSEMGHTVIREDATPRVVLVWTHDEQRIRRTGLGDL